VVALLNSPLPHRAPRLPRLRREIARPRARSSAGRRDLNLLPVDIVPDFNRDGVIDNKDRGKVTEDKPWRWWLNDDNDTGDLSNEDTPLGVNNSNNDSALGSTRIDGLCDLPDFFPLFFDIKTLLEVLPPESHQYHLKQEGAAVNFAYTDLKPDEAGKFLTDPDTTDALKTERTYIVFANGATQLSTEFLNKIKNDGKGVLLVEGGVVSDKPLLLQVFKDGQKLTEFPFHMNIDGVEKMYRWINVRAAAGQAENRATNTDEPENYPDQETNGKMFIFIHGYSVNEAQSRGWAAEGFKRMYQTGSRAMYTGVSWHGDSSQLWTALPPPLSGQALDYWENVTNAFKSSEALATAVNGLPGSTKVSAAHSLGNMLVSSAIKDHGLAVSKHFLFDAAVAIETYDPTALSIDQMRHPDWVNYVDANVANPRRLWATEWYQLFGSSDGRSKLTWRNRFGALAVAYNFYSSGEDVLNNSNGQVTLLPSGAERVWALQEMVKGTSHPGAVLTLDSNGGWGFNSHWNIEEEVQTPTGPFYTSRRRTPAEANQLTEEQLKTQPFFKRFQDARLMDASQGSSAANEYVTRAKVLGDAIPSLSFAVGRNPVPAFGGTRNFDLQNFTNSDGEWPAGRMSNDADKLPDGRGRWKHGDAKDVAYRFNYLLYRKWVELGELK
jgi:hypothetical protein